MATVVYNLKEMKRNEALVAQLEAQLEDGIVKFKFVKLNGTVRVAVGTRNKKLVANFLAGGSRTTEALPFFDLQEMAWRSLRLNGLLSIEEI
jgi:hypothetical protein